MRLIYKNTGLPVRTGDIVTLRNKQWEIAYAEKPHKPDSEGKAGLRVPKSRSPASCEFYVSVIGAEWVDREDRNPDLAYAELLRFVNRMAYPEQGEALTLEDYRNMARNIARNILSSGS